MPLPHDMPQALRATLQVVQPGRLHRATSLAALPAIEVLRNADLTAEALAQALTRLIAEGPRRDSALKFDGATQSVAIATQMAKARI